MLSSGCLLPFNWTTSAPQEDELWNRITKRFSANNWFLFTYIRRPESLNYILRNWKPVGLIHLSSSLGKVHLSCLEKWLNMVGRQYCEICSFHFQAVKKRRYGLCQSIRIWVRHPSHGMLLRSDLIVAGVLTLFTLGLVVVCLFGMRYFINEGLKMGVPAFYSQLVILSFLGVILAGYLVSLYLMAKDHIRPWYRWWSRCLIIRITIDSESTRPPPAAPAAPACRENV